MQETTHVDFFCSELAIERGEQLAGSATRVDIWFLLSYGLPFGRKAYDESEIPTSVKQGLNAMVRSTPNARIQLIRQQRSSSTQPMFYVAVARELGPVLYEFELSRYEEVLDLNIASIVAADPRYDEYISKEPTFLVCTNGMHDRCCARLGMPVYTQMAAREDVRVWQTSHVGGHRFAANVVCLPHGIIYGRLGPSDVTPIVSGYLSKTLVLDKLRGRSCYDAPVQAADYFLRTELALTDLDGLRLLQTTPVDGTTTEVSFLATNEGAIHLVRVAREPGALHTYTSCGADKESAIDQYRLVSHQVTH